MDNQMAVLNLSFMQLNNKSFYVFNAFFVMYFSVINASIEESTLRNAASNSLLGTIGQLFGAFNNLFVLTARSV